MYLPESSSKDEAFERVLAYVETSVSRRHNKKKRRESLIDPPDKRDYDENSQEYPKKIRKKKKRKEESRHVQSIKNSDNPTTPEIVSHAMLSKRNKEDIYSMARLLSNELQPFYDPVSGKEHLQSDIRTRSDHIGRAIKHGAYTKQEHEILKAALYKYFEMNGWSDQEGWNHISTFGEGSGRSPKQKEVIEARHWEKIAMALPKRSVRSVQLYTLRRLYPWKTGVWTEQEEKDLIDLVARYGYSWTKFAYEYFQRPPNYIQSKWRDLEPRLSHDQSLHPSKRHVWTKAEDIQLLKAIKTVTGVPLPYRAVPWREVQKYLPQFTPTALSWRYKNTLFPSILEGQFKGAKERVLFRQFLRYVKRSLEAGLIHDLSEVEGQRIVPFWYSSNHCRRMGRYIKARCPTAIQIAPLKKQIDYMYKLERCDKKEKHDLRRLARTYEALQKLNGVMVLPANPGILSQRYCNPTTPTTKNHEITPLQNVVSQNLFVTLPSTSQQHTPNEILRPLTADQHKVEQVVPPHLQKIPEAFPIYLESKKRCRRQKRSQKGAPVSTQFEDMHIHPQPDLRNNIKEQ